MAHGESDSKPSCLRSSTPFQRLWRPRQPQLWPKVFPTRLAATPVANRNPHIPNVLETCYSVKELKVSLSHSTPLIGQENSKRSSNLRLLEKTKSSSKSTWSSQSIFNSFARRSACSVFSICRAWTCWKTAAYTVAFANWSMYVVQ